jgi:acetyl coenzyme A synthetase (ADP forming)-like protein
VQKNLETLLSPKSVAIVGASAAPEKVGSIVLQNIISSGYKGHVYPVNPNTGSINGVTCYRDVASLPEIVDLVVIAIPSALVNKVLEDVGLKGIKNVVVFSAGYKEIGPEGKTLEDEMTQIAQKFGLNILGPNCLGFVNELTPINVTFGQPVKNEGKLRFISQSGALAASLFDYCNATGLGFKQFVTLGNKAVINENDVLANFLSQNDQNQFPTGLYLESISSGKEFFQICSRLSLKTPVFIIKPGKTQAAAKAMQSHTGAIAGEDTVLDEALREAGVLRCETTEDFFDLSRALSWANAPLGPKVAIVSNAGGPGVIAADSIAQNGLELVEFDDETKKKLVDALPRYASIINPVDVLGDALADRVSQACEIILETNQAHSLMVILTPQVMTQIEKTAEMIGNISKKYNIPIFCSFIGGSLIQEGEKKLNEYKIPSFRFPERAIATIGYMWRWKKWQIEQQNINPTNTSNDLIPQENRSKIKEIVEKAVAANQPTLDNIEANELLSQAGIPTPATQNVANLDEAKQFANVNRYPVILKVSAPGLLHKADVGALVKDVNSDDSLANAFNNLQNKIHELPQFMQDQAKIQIQKQVLNGTEVIVGIKRDPNFGPVLLFGAGGRLAELLMDRNLHLLPFDIHTAKIVVEESKIYPLLKGYRGEPALALDKLYNVLVRLTLMINEMPQADEIEINPVIITQNDVWAVDGKVVLSHTQTIPAPTVPKFHVAKTLVAETLAGKYHHFVFETSEHINFKPGQYVSIKVATTRINSYSIATKVADNQFSLLIDTSPGGPGSKYFENLKIGDDISYIGPFGIFTYKQEEVKNILFLATGSGAAPLRCMIDDLLKNQHTQTPITFYLGLRFQSDIFWKDYFEQLEKDYTNFHFKLVISKPDENWQGLKGHITDIVASDFPDASELSAYLCGNKTMIEETTNALISKGAKKERVYTEKF